MAKKKPAKTVILDRRTRQEMAELYERALALHRRGRLAEAYAVLRERWMKFPDQREFLILVAELAADNNEHYDFVEACERLARVAPNEPAVQFQRAYSYATVGLISLARHSFQEQIAPFPTHPRVKDSEQMLAMWDKALPKLHEEFHVPQEEKFEAAVQHDRLRLHLLRRQYDSAVTFAEKTLARWPQLHSVRNNLAEAHFALGRLDQALAVARESTRLHPDNAYARALLVRLLYIRGQEQEAREEAAILRDMPVHQASHWVRIAQSFSFMGDDQAVLGTLESARGDLDRTDPDLVAELFHLAAVSHWRLGNEDEARRLWRRALDRSPVCWLAKVHIDQVRLPVEQQDLPWAHPMSSWVSPQIIRRLEAIFDRSLEKATREQERQEVLALFAEYPWLPRILVILLDRGDPQARALAGAAALTSELPVLLAGLVTFARGQRGPDEMRLTAARFMAKRGLIPEGKIRLWRKGAWVEETFPVA